jgi:hypothetical protein
MRRDPAGMRSARKTLAPEDASGLLRCPQFINRLRKIRMVSNVSLPVRRKNGSIELLPEGYDEESQILTRPTGETPATMTRDEAVAFLRELHSEFPFANGDAERAIAVSLSAVLTLFAYELLPPNATRPGFLYSANAPGAGKTLLAKIAVISRLGCAPVTFHIEERDEMRKLLLAEAIAGKSVFFLDNVKGHSVFLRPQRIDDRPHDQWPAPGTITHHRGSPRYDRIHHRQRMHHLRRRPPPPAWTNRSESNWTRVTV